jgi:hypothetical protein
MKNLLTPEELKKFEEMASKKTWEVPCVLRGKFYILNEDMIIQGDRYTSSALLFENAQLLTINNKTVIKDGNRRYLYIEGYRFTEDVAESTYSKTYRIKIKTYHFQDALHPENVKSIEELEKYGREGIIADITDKIPEDIQDVKIQVKTWAYISHVGYDCDNDFSSWKCIDYSETYKLELIDTQEVELFKLLGYERKRKCKNLR